MKPFFSPCEGDLGSAECQARSNSTADAYYRSDIPGAAMMPMFECDIDDGECCGPVQGAPSESGMVCNQGNVGTYVVDVSSA